MSNTQKQDLFGSVAFLAVVVGLIMGAVAFWNFERTTEGEYKVVRNGGPFDNTQVRQVIQPGQGLTWTGLFSDTHSYPAGQRFFKISGDKDADGGAVSTPSSDGVDVGIEGTIYFNLSSDEKALADFDNRFATRKFGGLYPYDGDEGWSAFLTATVRPVIDANMRKQIGNFTCGELVSSCALLQNNGDTKVDKDQGSKNNQNIARIETAINDGLGKDLPSTLGGDFYENIKFQLVQVKLPQEVDDAVRKSQAAFAEVTQAQARVEQAKAEGQANRERQKGYSNCPACAEIDKLKAIPAGVQTYAPGNDVSVGTR